MFLDLRDLCLQNFFDLRELFVNKEGVEFLKG